MKKKVLFVATTHMHISVFHIPYIKWLKEQGCEVHSAANNLISIPELDKQYTIAIQRTPFSKDNFKAYNELREIILKENYDIVHCHTAMGAVIARLASREFRKKGLKVLYTAHGFHFFKGSPCRYWLMYYPVEKYLSKYTDAIITINQEDYDLVKTHNFRNQFTYKIPGIGINTSRLMKTNDDIRCRLRKEYGYKMSDFILIYIAEYIERKNHKFIIDATVELSKKVPNIKILFAGRGRLFEEMKSYSSNRGTDSYIDFLGFRKDIGQLIALSDVGISASKQEGLGLNLAEEMFCGLPVVATSDRGHKELIVSGLNGFIFPQNDKGKFIEYIYQLSQNEGKRTAMGFESQKIANQFTLDKSLAAMADIYVKFLNQKEDEDI